MDETILFGHNFVATLFGALLGFLQVFFESKDDRRALLLHRPISRSRVFLGKVLAGMGLYMLALGIPFAYAVGLAAAPGHVAAPFRWPLALPLLADTLTGVVFYFAGMLTAQLDGRWYGSRCLGLAAAYLCSHLVWTLPEFWHGLLAIMVLGTLLAVAAWGAFLTGGAYLPLPRLAKTALAMTFLAGLLVLSVQVKFMIGVLFYSTDHHEYKLDGEGRVLIVHSEKGKTPSATDLEGHAVQDPQGRLLDTSALREIEASVSIHVLPRFSGYRNPGRIYVEYRNDSSSGHERWYYVPDEGRLLGYDRNHKRLIGSFGPEGFVPPEQQARERFTGALSHYPGSLYTAGLTPYLEFPSGVYRVDFARRATRILFTPPEGQTLLWAVPWKDEQHTFSRVVVATDKAVHVVDEAGSPVLSVPLAYDLENYGAVRVGQLSNPKRLVVWYEPSWYLETNAGKNLPSYLVEYDVASHEIARRTLPPRPLSLPSSTQSLFGLGESMTEVAILVGTTDYLFAGARRNGGMENTPFLNDMVWKTENVIPGAGQDVAIEGGSVLAFRGLILLSAVVCAGICFLYARRYSFSRARCFGWALCGFFFGWGGLVLMLAVQEWPARIVCPNCRKLRVVTRDTCEHCGAPHATPAPDGTEIFEPTAAIAHAALAGR
jgi:hypothetical protein